MRRYRYTFRYLLITIISGLSHPIIGQEVKLPGFSFPDLSGQEVRSEHFDDERPLVVFYFDPICSHCEQQAEWVSENLDEFGEVDLLWVAWQPDQHIEAFRDRYFGVQENVRFVIDSDTEFDDLFGFSQIPTIYVYDSDKTLVRKFKKEVRAEKILKLLRE